MHHRCSQVRMNSSPLETAMEALVYSPRRLRGEQLVLRAGGEDVRVAVLAEHVEPAVGDDHRTPGHVAGPLVDLPDLLAGLQLVAVRDAVRFEDVNVLADDDAGADALRVSGDGARAGPW